VRRTDASGATVTGSRTRRAVKRPRIWRAPTPLARQARLISGESTGSFVGRLAALNNMPPDALMHKIGDGTKAMPAKTTEVYLNAPALERLAGLTGRSVPVLQRTLPHLKEHHLLGGGPGPAWEWPQWRAKGPVFLVRACDLCAVAKRRPSDVYLVSVTRWRVCVRHGRWLDNLREAGVTWLPLENLPDVVDAHRRRLLLERRLGGGGRALFADALHIAACWWNVPSLCPPVWGARGRLLGTGIGSDLRIAPLVVYPEAVRLAEMLAARERRRMRGTWGVEMDQAWLDAVDKVLEEWQMPATLALMPVSIWMQRHGAPPLAAGAGHPAQGKWRRLPAPLPHDDAPADTHLEELTCLSWRFGDEPLEPDLTMAWSVTGQA